MRSQTIWDGYFTPGSVHIWAFVDSWGGANVATGWIREINESNNLTGPVSFTVDPGKPRVLNSAANPVTVPERTLEP
jgi:hypothetical protein